MESPESLSHWCDLTRCDLARYNLLWALLLVFVSFCDHTKREGGLVSEWCVKLSTLKSDLVNEQGAKMGIAEVSCDWHLLSIVGFCVF